MTRPASNPAARTPKHRLHGQHWRAVYEPGPVRRFLGAVGEILAGTGRGVTRVLGWLWECLSLFGWLRWW